MSEEKRSNKISNDYGAEQIQVLEDEMEMRELIPELLLQKS